MDPGNPTASPQDIFDRFTAFVMTPGVEYDENSEALKVASRESGDDDEDDDEDDDDDKDLETSDETDDLTKPGATEKEKEKRKRRMKLAKLKKKTKARAYEFTGGSDVVGIVFLDIGRITDLPPERNSRVSTLLPTT